MSYADNKTYRDMYHFTGRYPVKNTTGAGLSMEKEPIIHDVIKENPYEASNVEIEGKELVLQPDLSAIFKAKGKKHKDGGMDVYLKPNSFVFSDDKMLAINKDEADAYELKLGGSANSKYIPEQNTPANILKKNIDTKHYNKLIENMSDPKKDQVVKNTSAKMLEKYIGTIGKVALLQEAKKDFPTGVPEFAQGIEPVNNPYLDDEMDSMKQYARFGGTIEKMQYAGFPKGKKLGSTEGWNKMWQNDVYTQYDQTVPGSNTPGKMMGNQQWLDFLKNETPEHKAARKIREINQQGSTNYGYTESPAQPIIGDPSFSNSVKIGNLPQIQGPDIQGDGETQLNPPEITGDGGSGVKRADWEFTPWQRVSQTYNLGKFLGAKRYLPYRSRYNATYVDPQLVNPEQTIGDMKGAANSQISSLNSLNPILRNAQASSAYGQYLNQSPGVRSQYDNQNAQIVNQTRQYNNQVKNNESQINMGNDQKYYQESIVGRQNFDNMKTYLGDQFMNNVISDVETNQKLAYNLMTMNNPAYGYDWKSGNFYRNKKDIMDAQTQGGLDDMKQLIKLADQVTDPAKKLELLTKIYGIKAFGSAINTQGSPFKKGGNSGNPYK